MSDHKPRSPIVVTHRGGLAFAIQVRSHVLIVDQPHGRGDDQGPMPIELLGSALGSCIALYAHQFCAARNIPSDGLRVEVETQGASNPSRIGMFTVRLTPPDAFPPEYLPLLERVAQSCPAHGTLGHGAEIAVLVGSPAAAAASG